MSPYREQPAFEPYAVLDPFPKTLCSECGAWTTSTLSERRPRCAHCDFRILMRQRRTTQTALTVFLTAIALAAAFEFFLWGFFWAATHP